jgi:enoyl-CoA hydratase
MIYSQKKGGLMTEKLIIKDSVGRVMVITLNRPQALNALSRALIFQLNEALSDAENNPDIGAVVLMGNERAFAAGVDIGEMKDQAVTHGVDDFIAPFEFISQCRKPIIAAVSGYALGGVCELAMMCDIILAADTAQFGQPEITIGTIPGIGGTQRLTRLIGKTKAMEMCLTGRMMDAIEAERCGLVTCVVPAERLREEAVALAQKIASFSQPVVQMVKEAIHAADNMPLTEGIRFERQLFLSTFDLEDQKEGMMAFLEKRKAVFKHR